MQARELQQAAQRGTPLAPLRGMRMGLVCGDAQAEAAAQFRKAAEGLGAQVTVLDPARVLGGDASLEELAKLLGRLYGAIACLGLPGELVRQLAEATAVPVFDARIEVPAEAADATPDAGIERDRRLWAAQAALLAALR